MQVESIQAVLERYLKKSGLDKPVQRYRTLQDWPDIVGKTIAAVTVPGQIRDGKLFVTVENDAWRHELIFYKQDMLEKINSRMDGSIIDIILL